MNRHTLTGAGSIAAVLSNRFARGIALAPFDETAFAQRFEEHHREVKGALDAAKTTATEQTKSLTEQKTAIEGMGARLTEVEQRLVQRRGSGGGLDGRKSIGQLFVESPEFKALSAGGGLTYGRRAQIEVKNITSVNGTNAAASGGVGALIAPDISTQPIIMPQRRMTIRDLISPGETTSNAVWFPQMTLRTNNAATVAENPSAPKPQSEFNLIQQQANVRTIAHWMLVSNQAMDDAPVLRGLIDSELRYGLDYQEETQILTGDGTGTNLLGIIPQATPYAQPPGIVPPATVTALDKLLMAFAQAELALLPATGVVLNPVDYVNILLLKDANGRYIGGGPLEALAQAFWSVPKVVTPAMPQNQFLVGAFKDGAQIFDRQRATVLASTEDRDNFVKNMTTVLGEERIALAVKRPAAFIVGKFQ